MSTIDLELPARNRSLTLYDRFGMGDIGLTFIDGGLIEFVGGGALEEAETPTNVLALKERNLGLALIARNRSLELPARNRSLTLEERP